MWHDIFGCHCCKIVIMDLKKSKKCIKCHKIVHERFCFYESIQYCSCCYRN